MVKVDLGNLLVLTNPRQAVAVYSLAIALCPLNPEAYLKRGLAYGQLKKAQNAIADYSLFLALAPPDDKRRAKTYYGRGLAHAGFNEWDQACADFTKAIELSPRNAAFWYGRGRAYARRAQWEKAAADFASVIELLPGEHFYWYQNACLCLRLGDLDGYRRCCRVMLEHFAQTADPTMAHQIALDCLLIPGAIADLGLPLQLARRAVEADPGSNWFLATLGAAHYRAGQFEQAVERLEQALKACGKNGEAGPRAAVFSRLFLAMTYHSTGHAPIARQWFDKAVDQIERDLPKEGSQDLGAEWQDWIMCQIIRREAEALLKKDAQP
jgi:tetratricopeptide (TPR) repeat protein